MLTNYKIIIFDFDNTLTNGDTLKFFVKFLEGKVSKKLLLFYVWLFFLRLKVIDNKKIKVIFLKYFIQGKAELTVKLMVKEFWNKFLKINYEIEKKLLEYKNSGYDIYIASGNFDFFLEPAREKWKVKEIICTKTEVVDGYFTGKIIGNICLGKEKLRKVIEELGEDKTKEAIFYGNRDDGVFKDKVKQFIEI